MDYVEIESNEPTLYTDSDWDSNHKEEMKLNNGKVDEYSTIQYVAGAIGTGFILFTSIYMLKKCLEPIVRDNIRNGYYDENEHYNRYHPRHPLNRFI